MDQVVLPSHPEAQRNREDKDELVELNLTGDGCRHKGNRSKRKYNENTHDHLGVDVADLLLEIRNILLWKHCSPPLTEHNAIFVAICQYYK